MSESPTKESELSPDAQALLREEKSRGGKAGSRADKSRAGKLGYMAKLAQLEKRAQKSKAKAAPSAPEPASESSMLKIKINDRIVEVPRGIYVTAIFTSTHRVTYAECTVGNHVYHARYLDLLEAARGEFFRQLGATLSEWQAQDAIFPIIECRLRFKAPARYDDVLTLEVWPLAVEKIRINFAHRILNQHQTLILEAETFHVCTGLNEKPKRLPAELVANLQPHLRSTEFPARPLE